MTRSESRRYVRAERKSRERRRLLPWCLASLAVVAAAAALVALRPQVWRGEGRPGPEPLPLQIARVDALAQQGRLPEAIAEAHAVLELSPGDENLRQRLAHWLFSVGRFDEAGAQCRQCLARRPDDAPLQFL